MRWDHRHVYANAQLISSPVPSHGTESHATFNAHFSFSKIYVIVNWHVIYLVCHCHVFWRGEKERGRESRRERDKLKRRKKGRDQMDGTQKFEVGPFENGYILISHGFWTPISPSIFANDEFGRFKKSYMCNHVPKSTPHVDPTVILILPNMVRSLVALSS